MGSVSVLVPLALHRYYGDSIPVPVSRTADFKWLTIQQVIEDTARLLTHVRAARKIPDAVPAIVIGGSYGEEAARVSSAVTLKLCPQHAWAMGACSCPIVQPQVETTACLCKTAPSEVEGN